MYNLAPKLLTLLSAFMLFAAGMSAQTSVKGQVKDAEGNPLPGVSVLIKGTNTGTVTDVDGHWSLLAGSTDILRFSYLGMETQNIRVGDRALIDVTMREDVAFLEETVVVGYGTQKRSSLTGAISTVSDEEILRAPTMSISNMVGSRIAGIAAFQASGQPGADNASLTIRGQGNIIYVIDGIRRSAADFNGLDPNEIESISVLKDASAVAVYGLDASGAFVVTTRQGRDEKVRISYTGTVGISQNAEKQKWLDAPSYAYWYNKARVLQGDEEVFTAEQVRKMIDGVDGWGNTNWYDKIYGTGFRQTHNISASGGGEKVKFFASMGYLDEQGNIRNYDYDRINLRLNAEARIRKSWTLNVGIAGRIEDRDAPFFSASPKSFMNIPQQTCYALPYVPEAVADENGDLIPVATPSSGSPVTPLASRDNSGYSRSRNTYIQTNFSLRYDAPWLKGLSAKFQGGVRHEVYHDQEPPYPYGNHVAYSSEFYD